MHKQSIDAGSWRRLTISVEFALVTIHTLLAHAGGTDSCEQPPCHNLKIALRDDGLSAKDAARLAINESV